MGIGEISALTAALLWTISSLLWRKIHLSAWTMNLAKNILGSLMLCGHLLFTSLVFSRPVLEASVGSVGYLFGSGMVGVVIGDTLYFRSLQILGPRRALMVATISPLFSVVLGWFVLGEVLASHALIGMVLTIGGVVAVVGDRAAAVESPNLIPGQLWQGVACGVAGALCQAVGGVMSRIGTRDCSGLEAACYRVGLATIVMLVVWAFSANRRRVMNSLMHPKVLRVLVPATIVGTWLGILFSQIAYKFSDVAIAQTLLSTCPLFAVPLVWLADRNRISMWSILGTVIAIVGVYLVMA